MSGAAGLNINSTLTTSVYKIAVELERCLLHINHLPPEAGKNSMICNHSHFVDIKNPTRFCKTRRRIRALQSGSAFARTN